jgi:hypothetical protein
MVGAAAHAPFVSAFASLSVQGTMVWLQTAPALAKRITAAARCVFMEAS